MISELFTFEAKEVLDFSIKIGIATVSGLLIGLEREYKGKSAGLKTNALVAIGAAVYVLISLKFQGEDYAAVVNPFMVSFFCNITPPPKKPIPVTT